MLGRLVHYGVDAVLFSTLLAGVKRHSGWTPDLSRVSDDTVRSVAGKYVGIGEFIFDSTVAAANASAFFTKVDPNDDVAHSIAAQALRAAEAKGRKEGWFK